MDNLLSRPRQHATLVCFVLALLLPGQGNARFTDQTLAAGVAFEYIAGGDDKEHIVEGTGGGAAFFDYDNDGDLDLYAVNGATVSTYRQKSGPGNVLYRNDGNGIFSDISAPAGVDDSSWGMGCTVGDTDGDGHRDLYVNNYGPNLLYRNLGDQTFRDISVAAGVAGDDYSASAAFFDYDNDGDLDLYVTTYLAYDIDSPPSKICTYGGAQVYCGPQGLPGAGDVLYRNNGDNSFTDITDASGIAWANHYYGLGVLPADLDNDGDTDLFVANDATPNVLFRNNGNSTFTEIGLVAGVAYNANGDEEAGMGVSGGDYDNDGDIDFYVTHFFRESNTLYRNDGQGHFKDITAQIGLQEPTLASLAWGTQFFDYDNDADLDLFVANGHFYPQVELERLGTSYSQYNQLFRNDSANRLVEAPDAGPGLAIKKVSRGASFGDYDNDGDIDVFVVNIDDRATLLRNDWTGHNWLVVQLFGTGANRDAIGAKVQLRAGGKTQWRNANGASSYLSYNDTRLHFGLGNELQAEVVEITWPDGSHQQVGPVPANKLLVVHKNGAHALMAVGADPY